MDQARFQEACRKALAQKPLPQGIGTLGEKTLHRVLKAYFQPDPSKCEVRVGPYVADALTESGIVEIQTRSFYKLRPKLKAFLEQAPVTVVYPVPAVKWLIWISEGGEPTPPPEEPCQACSGAGFV